MALLMKKADFQLMVEHCLAAQPNEACGLLAGKDGQVEKVYLTTNIKASPFRYEVDPEELVAILEEINSKAQELLGIFHSHPGGRAYPSPEDVRLAFYPGARYVIIGLDPELEVRAFWIKEGRVADEDLFLV